MAGAKDESLSAENHAEAKGLFSWTILTLFSFSQYIICMSAWWDVSQTDMTLCSMQLLYLSHPQWLKIAYPAQGQRHWFSLRGTRSQTCNSLSSHICVSAWFLIACVRGSGLWGDSGTRNHFVFPCKSHSTQSVMVNMQFTLCGSVDDNHCISRSSASNQEG